ncbi:MAG: Serine/threonine-protein kinase PrkC [Chloroflexi bacterium ADurb.Bin360]|nr:MAG: Serine/threonine-protein kinase PrkC [Chloroflexi bacterium ADurb.Bin360]
MQQENLIGTTMGQYQILDELGRGGMALVYKAWQPSLRRYVALKVLLPYLGNDPEFIQRFQQEAIVAANLSHPHIVTIYEVGQHEGHIFIAMEYVEGMSLEQLILDQGALPLERTTRILRQVAEALDYAHKRRFLHRDIKPANILLAEDDRVVITDFGIAKALEGSGATARLTSSGTVLGTPAYMSPEQIQGLAVDHRSDLYAFGIVAYEMLSGQVPFDGTTTALLYAQVNNPPPAITRFAPGLPPHVEWVISRMLAKQPSERFISASEFVEALLNGGNAAAAAPAYGATAVPRFPTPPPQSGTAVMPSGASLPQAAPPLPAQPYGYSATQAAPVAPGVPPQPYGPPAAIPSQGYGYPQQGYAPSASGWVAPVSEKKKRAVWPWLLGGTLVLAIVAAVAVLGYLFLFRQTPARLLEEGTTALTAQDYVAAQAAFESALEKEPGNSAAQRGLGWVYYQTGRYAEAMAAFGEAVKSDPTNLEGQEGLGRSAYAAERYEEALAPLQSWAAGATTNAEAQGMLGWTTYRLKRYDEAVQAFSRAVELAQTPAEYRGLGDSYRALGEHEAAAEAYQRWVELAPEDAEAQRTLGETLNVLQRYDEAVAAFTNGGPPRKMVPWLRTMTVSSLIAGT